MNLPKLPEEFNCCVCVKAGGCVDTGKRCSLCFGSNGFQEKGQQVKLVPQSNDEQVKAIVLDGCLLSDGSKKSCDGLFLFSKASKVYIVLVELKGTHIEDACDQLACVKNEHQEYVDLFKLIENNKKVKIIERFFIVTNVIVSPRELMRFNKEHNMKFRIITNPRRKRRQNSTTPDLRKFLVKN